MTEHDRKDALEVVRAGYDRLGARYSEERASFDNWTEIKAFADLLPERAQVLDAGCGTGLPVAKFLADSGYQITGIDISEEMIAVASANVPKATFVKKNMAEIDFPAESFDGVISCYAIIHNPRETHAEIFRSFHRLLRPQGIMLVSVASWAWEEFADFMGVDMFWSHFEPAQSQALIADAGFEIVFARDVEAGDEKHHWILARKVAP